MPRHTISGLPRVVGAVVLVAAALLSLSPKQAGGQATTNQTFIAGANITGNAPPGLIYQMQVSCTGNSTVPTTGVVIGGSSAGPMFRSGLRTQVQSLTRNLRFTATGTQSIVTPLSCNIVEYFISGQYDPSLLISVTKQVVTDRFQVITWAWVGSTSTSTTPTTAPVVTPKISVDPVDFGNVLVGQSVTRQAVIRNNGDIAVVIRDASTTPPFSVFPSNCALNPGESCSIDVSVNSAKPGDFSALLTVGGSGVNRVGVAAQGTLHALYDDRGDVLLTTPVFTPVLPGQTSPVADATLTNVGSLPFNVKNVAVTGPFATVGNKCPVLLEPGKNCTVQMVFRPTAAGPATGLMVVSLAGATLLDLRGTLSAVGLAPLKESLAFDPSSVALGDVPQGSPAKKVNVRLVNTGGVALTVASIGTPVTTGTGTKKKVKIVALTGAVTISGPCKGRTLKPKEACNLVVSSLNTTGGQRSVTIRAVSAAGTSADLSVKGRVLKRGLAVSGPSQLGLLDRTVPKTAQVVVTNTGELPLGVASVAVPGTATTGIRVAADTCSKQTLAVGAKCTLTVSGLLASQPPGTIKDRVVVTGTAGEKGQGDVVAKSPLRALTVTPKVADFGKAPPGVSVERKLTVKNVGDLPATVKDVSVSGSGAAAFVPVAGAACVGTVLPVGGQCVIRVTATSPTVGSFAANLNVSGADGEKSSAGLRFGAADTPVVVTTAPATTAPPVVLPTCPSVDLRAPAVSPRGRPVSFEATGYPANAEVQVGWNGGGLQTFTADAVGTLTGSIMVQNDDPLGTRTLELVFGDGCPPTQVRVLIVLDTATPPRAVVRRSPVFR